MTARGDATAGAGWHVFWISFAVLGFEIALMRILLVTSWHHFAFLVISIALLGFGASGTLMTIARRVVMPRRQATLFGLSLATAITIPGCTALAQLVPVEARFAPALVWHHVGSWVAFWAILTVPFLLGASAICLALMGAGARLPRVYAANLLGSGAGAIAAPAGMLVVPPELLAAVLAAPALLAALAIPRRGVARIGAVAACAAVIAAWMILAPVSLRLDPFKYGASLERLEAQGAVERVGRRHGPRGLVEAWRGTALHDLPFLSVDAVPPRLGVITIDGHLSGSVLEVEGIEGAAAVDHALMSFAYELAPSHPEVLLLGEIGGANVWLAARRNAAAVVVAQPHRDATALLRGELRDHGGHVVDRTGVTVVHADPRHFVDQGARSFDVIQLAQMESIAAGSGGVGGMAEDFLLTREGLGACLDRLTPAGVLFVCRGIQTPPRDNVKLMATLVDALRRRGVDDPGRHLIVVRDYLAVCTVVRLAPWTAADGERARELCARRGLTPVWFPGVVTDELNTPDVLPAAPDGVGDEYHYAVRELVEDPDALIGDWVFDIRPPSDDRPFFYDMCRLGAIGRLQDAFGDLWLTRSEVAFLFVLAAGAAIVIAGTVMILLPLPWLRGVRAGRWAIMAYFAAIGLGYLLLEMTMLSRVTRLIGDPVIGASVTISGFLVLSGMGSLTAQRAGVPNGRTLAALFGGLLIASAVALATAGVVAGHAGGWSMALRIATALALFALPAYLMGFPMPLGLAQLERAAPATIPWAWAVNGFASVLAIPLSMVIGMTWGFTAVGVLALVLYATAGLTARPGR